jgi:membrane associated rhomboid family serine protease
MNQEQQPLTCYRHPDRETGRRCTRCGRPACPECLREAAVGSHCVECVKAAAPSTRERVAGLARGQNMLATKTIIGITVAAFVVIGLRDTSFQGTGRTAADLVLYGPLVHHGEWWRVFTVSLVHEGVFHILFNMLLLWIIGQILEPGAGPVRFGLLYVVSVAAGSAAALIATPHAVSAGASGGVFGVAAAATIVMQRQGVRFWDTGFGPLLVINLVLDYFVLTNVSIAAHIGGAIGGLLAAEAMLQGRKAGHPELGLAGAAAVGIAAFILALSVAHY